jgi:hypothetical protein
MPASLAVWALARFGTLAFGLLLGASPEASADDPMALVGPVPGATASSSPPASIGYAARPGPAGSLTVSEEQARASVQWLASLALEKAPRKFDGDKDWGDQKKRWSGVRVRRDGWKLKTNRRWKEVNHGRWIKYEVNLPASAATGGAEVTVHAVRQTVDPTTGEKRWQIESSMVAPMTFTARIQRWNLGVKLFSMTISGDIRARLVSTASVGFVADYSEVPPALVVDPRIEKAEVILEHFEVDRISKIGGDVAEEWGELMEDVIRDRFLSKQNDKLVAKLNKSIDKERDDLRLSMAEWFASW